MEIDIAGPVREQLAGNEHLLWSGQPTQGIRLRSADAFIIPFSLMWGGFAFFWEWSVVRTDAPFFFKLWGIPFVLAGLHFMFGRFFWDSHVRRSTYYGVSDQRVLIVTRGLSAKVKSLNLRSLSDISFSGSSSGAGVIQFGANSWGGGGWLAGTSWPGVQAVPMFDLPEDAKRVYELIRQAQQKAQ